MTKNEAAIVSAYTGYMLGKFEDLHEYIEKIIGRPVFTHELASEDFGKLIQEKAKQDFVTIKIE